MLAAIMHAHRQKKAAPSIGDVFVFPCMLKIVDGGVACYLLAASASPVQSCPGPWSPSSSRHGVGRGDTRLRTLWPCHLWCGAPGRAKASNDGALHGEMHGYLGCDNAATIGFAMFVSCLLPATSYSAYVHVREP